jgi:hypothetical protein
MTKAQILTAISSLASANETVLGNVRTHALNGQAGTPFDPARPTFAGVTLSPSDWQTVGRIERTAAEVDSRIATVRRELNGDGGSQDIAVQQHQDAPQRIAEAMANLNSDIAAITSALLAKSVTFQWSLLPER